MNDITETKTTVYVVDDDSDARYSMECLVKSMGFNFVSFSCAEDFLQETKADITGCVLADFRMLGCNGIQMLIRLRELDYLIPFIMISAYADVKNTVKAMSEGAMTVLEKPYLEQELWDSIVAAISIDKELRKKKELVDNFYERESGLTVGERKVMKLLLQGESNKNIGYHLEISQRTVVIRRNAILSKLQVDNVVDLAKLVSDVNNLASHPLMRKFEAFP